MSALIGYYFAQRLRTQLLRELDSHRNASPLDHPDNSVTDAKIQSVSRDKITDLWSTPFWDNIPDKPSEYPPEAHMHSRADITDLWTDPFWDNIPDKPSQFPPEPHASTHAKGGTDEVSLDASQIVSGELAVDRLPVTDMWWMMFNLNRLKIDYGGAFTDIDVVYRGGWLFLKYTGSYYPAVWYSDPVPWQGLAATGIPLHHICIVYIPVLKNLYLCFTERFRGEATTSYTGFYLSSDGTLSFRSYPANKSATIGTVSAGTTLLLDTVLYYDSDASAWKVYGIAYTWDWSSKSFSSLGSASLDETGTYKYKYFAVVEANATAFEIGISYVFHTIHGTYSAVNGNLHWHWRKAVDLGLIKDPSTVYPW